MNGKDKVEKKCGISIAAHCLRCSQTDTQVVVAGAITKGWAFVVYSMAFPQGVR